MFQVTGCTASSGTDAGRRASWGRPGTIRLPSFTTGATADTATGTDDGGNRPYRFGYGVLDENLNMVADAGEKKVYFEVSDYSTPYVFFESPR